MSSYPYRSFRSPGSSMSKIQRCAAAAAPSENITLSGSSLISLAAHRFMYSYLDEDESPTFVPVGIIVAEILPRLHVKPLFRFKCVSKIYNSIISDLNFGRSYLQRAYSSLESSFSAGLLPSMIFPFTDLSPFRDRFSRLVVKDLAKTISERVCRQYVDDLSITVSTVSLPYDDGHKIKSSSNGLILSYFHNRDGLTFCVSNPLTKQCVTLPPRHIDWDNTMDLCIATRRYQGAFLSYKVVILDLDCDDIVGPQDQQIASIEVFSSDTGSWVTWKPIYPGKAFDLPSEGCFAYKGILHWLDRDTMSVLTYDPYDNPDRFGQIPLPNRSVLITYTPTPYDTSDSPEQLSDSPEQLCQIPMPDGKFRRLPNGKFPRLPKGKLPRSRDRKFPRLQDRKFPCSRSCESHRLPERRRLPHLQERRFDRGFLTKAKCASSSLIYSGDDEMLKYCEIQNELSPGFDNLRVWRLEADSKWCLEGEFQVPSLPYNFKVLMVAPHPWNRGVLCHPILDGNKASSTCAFWVPPNSIRFLVIHPRSGWWKMVEVFSEPTLDLSQFRDEDYVYRNRLIPIELCPWSSPFYAKAP